MNYKNTAFEGNWAPSTCATFELSEIKSYEEANSQFVAGEPDLLSCFCYDKFKTLTFGILTNDALLELGGGENPCTEWFTNYTIQQSLTYGIAAAISIMNFLLRLFLREFSRFEAEHTVSKQIASSITKMWIVQYVNTGIIILMVNHNYDRLFEINSDSFVPLLNGKFNDFVSDWYVEVGALIVVTTFVSTVFPALGFLFYCQAKCRRCRDRGCSSNVRSTKKIL
jgi:hypothetical protein